MSHSGHMLWARAGAGLCLAALFAVLSGPGQAQSQRARTAAPATAAPTAAAAPAAAAPASGPVESIFRGAKLSTTPVEPPDWVRQTRPAQTPDFIPVQRVRPEPSRAPMPPERVRQMEAELDALRARHDALGGRKPVKTAQGSVAGDPSRRKAKKKKKTAQPCVLTCASAIRNIRPR